VQKTTNYAGNTGYVLSKLRAFARAVGSSDPVIPADADIAEIVWYPSALSAADIAQVESYLSAKWGITLP